MVASGLVATEDQVQAKSFFAFIDIIMQYITFKQLPGIGDSFVSANFKNNSICINDDGIFSMPICMLYPSVPKYIDPSLIEFLPFLFPKFERI